VQKRAAELLGIKPTTLNEMIKRYDIGIRRGRKGAGHDDDEGGSSKSRQASSSTQATRE
jgi:hypothetical protein